ncbi:MAG: hypothetical protein ACR2NB_00590 [Solirubrobacteraceae bacterium]
MPAATLRDEVLAALQSLAWDQWSQLGVSAAAPDHREQRAIDPEALLLFTLEIGRTDPRLFDEVMDWLAVNESLVSVHRLRNLCAGPDDRALVDAALAWTARERRRERPAASARTAGRDGLAALFPGFPAPTDGLDPAFLRHGLTRTRLERSGKSQPPRLHDPISFAFRLRRLLGVGVRAEVVRTLLTIRAPRLSGRVITASAAFAQRNVREGLTQLHDAGVITGATVADDRQYSIRREDWATLLGLPSAADLPLHYDWVPVLRALTQIARWLQQPALGELTPYLLASQARTLVDAVDADLRYAGVPRPAHAARGGGFWDEFVAIVRAAILDAVGPVPSIV